MATAPKAKKTSVKIDKSYYEGVGRRKTSIARVRVYHSKKAGVTINDVSYKAGSFIVNNQDIAKWAQTISDAALLKKPLAALGDENTFVVYARVLSGGAKGQRDAIMHGLSRALTKNSKQGTSRQNSKQKIFLQEMLVQEKKKSRNWWKSQKTQAVTKALIYLLAEFQTLICVTI
ncbi:MAG: 30S ribosomal protein S9 [Patescibacteria group bacterium]